MRVLYGPAKLKAVALVTLVVGAPIAYAQLQTAPPPETPETQPAWADDVFRQVKDAVARYNERVDDVYRLEVWGIDAGRLRGTIRHERVNVYVVDRDGENAVFSFRIDDNNRVSDLRQGKRTDATLRVVTDRETIRRIEREYTHTRALKRSFMDDDIRVEGVGPLNALRWWIIVKWTKHGIRNGNGGGVG